MLTDKVIEKERILQAKDMLRRAKLKVSQAKDVNTCEHERNVDYMFGILHTLEILGIVESE